MRGDLAAAGGDVSGLAVTVGDRRQLHERVRDATGRAGAALSVVLGVPTANESSCSF